LTLYLEYETVVSINAEYGGVGAGVADEVGIRSAIAQPSQGWSGGDFYPTVWHKAAALMRGLSATQYFSDGNKRTSYLSALAFLGLNGIRIVPVEPILSEVFVLGVASSAVSIDKAAEWFWAAESSWSRLTRRARGLDVASPNEISFSQ
jgi:death-on-curing protein